MQRRWRQRAGLAASAVGLLASSGCVSSSPQHPGGPSAGRSVASTPGTSTSVTSGASPSPSPSPSACVRTVLEVPACGVLWGVATQTPSLTSVRDLESRVGRRFDLVYRFHRIGDAIPTPDERAIAASGRLLHLSLDSPSGWSGIAKGSEDAALSRTAEGIASLGVPVFVTFDHEANQPSKAALGSPEAFVAAWRHVHDLFAAAGATKVIWVWVMMGSPESLASAGAFWPGNEFVDWVSWDVYNQSGCLAGGVEPARYESFADDALPFYRWVHSDGAAAGIDPSKPMMISETGSVAYAGDPALTARWYGEIPGFLASHRQIRAVGLWDHTGNELCDYRFDGDAQLLRAVAAVGADPRVTGAVR